MKTNLQARVKERMERELARLFRKSGRREFPTVSSARHLFPVQWARYQTLLSSAATRDARRYEDRVRRLKVRLASLPATFTDACGGIERVTDYRCFFHSQTQPEAYEACLTAWVAKKFAAEWPGLRVECNGNTIRVGGFPPDEESRETVRSALFSTCWTGYNLRDFVKFFWSRALQPRVLLPFLPYNFESENRLDYQGRDIA